MANTKAWKASTGQTITLSTQTTHFQKNKNYLIWVVKDYLCLPVSQSWFVQLSVYLRVDFVSDASVKS